MRKALRIGVIGGGKESAIGAAHMAAIRMDGAYTLGPSMFSHLEDVNRASHDAYGLSWRGHKDDLGSWLDAYTDELDLVALLTPSVDHARQLVEIIDRGLSVLVEKPIACGLSEIKMVSEALARVPEVQARFVHNYSSSFWDCFTTTNFISFSFSSHRFRVATLTGRTYAHTLVFHCHCTNQAPCGYASAYRIYR